MKKNGVNLRTLQEKLADKHYREIWEKVRNQLFDETTDMIITIEQQLAEKDKEIEKYKQQCYDCKHLHKKLELNIKNKLINDIENLRAEKDKEIGQLKSALEYNENNIPNQRKAICHQVCQEIKHKIYELSTYDGVRLDMDGIDLLEFLDQIEGEKE